MELRGGSIYGFNERILRRFSGIIVIEKKKSIKVKTRTRKSTNKPGYRFLVSLTGP